MMHHNTSSYGVTVSVPNGSLDLVSNQLKFHALPDQMDDSNMYGRTGCLTADPEKIFEDRSVSAPAFSQSARELSLNFIMNSTSPNADMPIWRSVPLWIDIENSITPHAAGTLEHSGLPQAVEYLGQAAPLPIASEQWHKIVLKVGPDAAAVSSGIGLWLRKGEDGNEAPQSGFTLKIQGENEALEALTVPADGKITLAANDPEWQRLTSPAGLTLFMKRETTVSDVHNLSLQLLKKHEWNSWDSVRIASMLLLPVEISSPHAANAHQMVFSNSDDDIYRCPDWVAANNMEKIHENALVIYHKNAPSASMPGRRYVEIDFSVGGIQKIEGLGWAVSRKSINGHSYTSWSDRTLTKKYVGDKVAGNSAGLYRYHLEGTEYYGNVWLPLAGPDIAEYWESETTYFKTTWKNAYSAKLRRLSEPLQRSTIAMVTFWTKQAASDMARLGQTLDWNDSDRILKDYAPTAGSRDNGNARYTCYERVLDLRKSSNLMYALIGRCMGLEEAILSNAGDPGNWFGKYVAGATGTPDSPAAKESYQAGFDLFDGTDLKDVMINRGEKMQEPDSWAQKEWPSEEKSAGKLKRTNEQLLQEIIQ